MARFLLCHAPFGSGHTVAKEAIEEAIRERDTDAEIISINVFSYLPSWAEKAMIRFYLWILAHCPSLYRWSYRAGNARCGSTLLMRFIASLMRARLADDICRHRPDTIVCTHAVPARLAGELVCRGEIGMIVIAVVTDHVVHRMWMHRGVTRYFVAHEGLVGRFASCGMADADITVSGIPVRAQFCLRGSMREGNRILVMGGGMGLMSLEPILRAAERIDAPVIVHIITGSEAARRRTLETAQQYSCEMIVDGYNPYVADAMRRASVLITKAGGVSVAEAMAIGIPLILFGSLAGQEEGNTEFLKQSGAALTADNEEELYQSLSDILRGKDAVSRMLAVQAELGRPYAARTIAESICQMIKQKMAVE
ncbi:MAG: hypothetical protein J6K70_05955 [Selenomonadales bacterium]|nr:hypothetical protein [Selenomonadales bacterium]